MMGGEKRAPGEKVLSNKKRRAPRRRGRTGTGAQNAPQREPDLAVELRARAQTFQTHGLRPRHAPLRVPGAARGAAVRESNRRFQPAVAFRHDGPPAAHAAGDDARHDLALVAWPAREVGDLDGTRAGGTSPRRRPSPWRPRVARSRASLFSRGGRLRGRRRGRARGGGGGVRTRSAAAAAAGGGSGACASSSSSSASSPPSPSPAPDAPSATTTGGEGSLVVASIADSSSRARASSGPFYTSERRGGVQRRQLALKGIEDGD